ncbi:bifunctional tRNA (5-methylaminomethyl-2-thiouridine)(34)-methyltransferase MnmD/FAD-dependent 5-carboxymethylaminomethyl-2-thiouridine(34) oxidoreductase MnmC [Aidingimonas halophila]|uniref:tRNA 5-methylaminomethyl-2-thiouridine biosynthesis bifunctional protein MnmC n=1 Tax=Aidingimonas halophila TaxID=574349 RepID=A0A1H2V6X8_9GAMM|nr:bifunctional tRNA (5-methylaminomethyl-2-thiouridine)(34)-methyltransferase MnmD/FAD-dependent 5-carboxymethylaminomethyl-2-thiouridine(34) oxidoreductase MnmC [Aidingimonas halophila]GHC23872.1 tRNA 5-methylaminomethyl-2-thiouridine biosynthesis bifunctional protein MnmC [Aidingimonas halophila]SDW64078.1 tRNA 5-methylaminomethyl-2-thiouridine biosynthesis bifunctional protein [Aidingimonas halophila]
MSDARPDELPPLSALETATLDWHQDDTGQEVPNSTAFGDVYFSRHDGRAETEHVFVQGNDLPQRLADWTAPRPFVIGETGFGTGLNMLCAWDCFERHAPVTARLHLISTERYPLRQADLARALASWPNFAAKARCLIEQWPAPVAGVHRLWLDERVTLDLHFGDSTTCLSHLDGRIDAWFLDGFAPAKNADMWHPSLFEQMAHKSRPGATFATFTCAGIVKRGLKAAGFDWHKRPGYGRKREMLAGAIETPPRDPAHDATPWYEPPRSRTPRHVVVIGAGLAGTTVAHALARRGVEVTLLDRQTPGAGASGNRQGALYIKLAAETNLQSRCYLAGLMFSRRWLSVLDPERTLWNDCGVLQLALDEKERRRQQRFLANHSLPPEIVKGVDAVMASELAGTPLTHGGLDYPQAGWVRPDALCERLATAPGVTWRQATVMALSRDRDGWQIALADGKSLTAEHVVVATAWQASRFAELSWLPCQPVRGQVSWLSLPAGAPGLQRVVCAGGYVPPPCGGILSFGATFNPNDTDDTSRQADHDTNLVELERTLPDYMAALRQVGADLDAEHLQGRSAIRAASPDKTPYAGPVPDAHAWHEDYAVLAKDATRVPITHGRYHHGLWVSAAHGSRGLTSAPLCAEVIASRLCDEPMPLERALVDHLNPGRRLLRDIIRGHGS